MRDFIPFRRALLLSCIVCFSLFLDACKKEINPVVERINTDGLGLYWHHEIFDERGRGLLFDFGTMKGMSTDYDLKFAYTVNNNIISIQLIDVVELGSCLSYPGFLGDQSLPCRPNGTVFIPDKLLPDGKYNLELVTENFRMNSELLVTKEKVSLTVPANPNLRSNIKDVYPIPEKILFGTIVYEGTENEKFATDFIRDLSSLGIKPAVLPDYPYRHLDVKQDSNLQQSSWDPDFHSIAVLYTLNDAKPVFDLAQKYFDLSEKKLSMYFYSGKGDQAKFNKDVQVLILYAK